MGSLHSLHRNPFCPRLLQMHTSCRDGTAHWFSEEPTTTAKSLRFAETTAKWPTRKRARIMFH